MPIERKVFRKLMFIATQGIFMFGGKLYKQIDGVTTRNPLGPTLANFFLGHLKKHFLKIQIIKMSFQIYIYDILMTSTQFSKVKVFVQKF